MADGESLDNKQENDPFLVHPSDSPTDFVCYESAICILLDILYIAIVDLDINRL